jgi:protein involved in polysaccharide export with SLBB domain
MDKHLKSTIISLLFLLPGCLLAQASMSAPAAAPVSVTGLDKPIISEEYFLMPGDEIMITVSGAINYSYMTNVTYEGKVMINIPVSTMITTGGTVQPKYDVVEAVPISGLSLKTAKDSLRVVFQKYFRNVNINATLINMRTIILFVVGEVRNPGTIQARPIDRVSEVVKYASGITTLGSRSKIQLKREGQLFAIVNLEKFETQGDLAGNPYVKDGDVVFVPKMDQSVIVQGAVFGKGGYELRVSQLTAAQERTSEGLYELNPGERIMDLILKAGGTTPWADLSNAYINRESRKIPVDLTRAVMAGDTTANQRLLNGDVLVIPSINALVYVQGMVENPGSFAYQANFKVLDYIGLAGGPTVDADQGGARIYRGNKKISIRGNPVIEPGDRIYVPRQVFKFWQDYVEILSVAVSILISYLTLRTATTR